MEQTAKLEEQEKARKILWDKLQHRYRFEGTNYVTGPWWTVALGFFPPDPDERGAFQSWWYVVRDVENDPKRMTRKERQAMYSKVTSKMTNQTGHGSATAWQKARKRPVEQWREGIMRLFTEDPRPKTFNHICLALTDFEYTADVLSMGKADTALFQLVAERKIAHTLGCPAYFTHSRAYKNDNDEWVLAPEEGDSK